MSENTTVDIIDEMSKFIVNPEETISLKNIFILLRLWLKRSPNKNFTNIDELYNELNRYEVHFPEEERKNQSGANFLKVLSFGKMTSQDFDENEKVGPIVPNRTELLALYKDMKIDRYSIDDFFSIGISKTEFNKLSQNQQEIILVDILICRMLSIKTLTDFESLEFLTLGKLIYMLDDRKNIFSFTENYSLWGRNKYVFDYSGNNAFPIQSLKLDNTYKKFIKDQIDNTRGFSVHVLGDEATLKSRFNKFKTIPYVKLDNEKSHYDSCYSKVILENRPSSVKPFEKEEAPEKIESFKDYLKNNLHESKNIFYHFENVNVLQKDFEQLIERISGNIEVKIYPNGKENNEEKPIENIEIDILVFDKNKKENMVFNLNTKKHLREILAIATLIKEKNNEKKYTFTELAEEISKYNFKKVGRNPIYENNDATLLRRLQDFFRDLNQKYLANSKIMTPKDIEKFEKDENIKVVEDVENIISIRYFTFLNKIGKDFFSYCRLLRHIGPITFNRFDGFVISENEEGNEVVSFVDFMFFPKIEVDIFFDTTQDIEQ
ncbi:MAG: hypothetical protein AB7U85_00445 [Alphaproteobacteria bacterium]